MRTPANIAGHPIHPMLVSIPIGCWVFSLAADLIGMRSAVPQNWSIAAYYTMIAGIVGALAAAVFGLIDLLSIKDGGIKRTGITHMSLNLAIVALYAINAWTRHTGSVGHNVSLGLSVLAILLLLGSGWLGGKMVYLAGVAVDTDGAATSARTAMARPDRAAGWSGYNGAAGREHAMASDATRPSAGTAREREDRASAGRMAGDQPDKTSERNR